MDELIFPYFTFQLETNAINERGFSYINGG